MNKEKIAILVDSCTDVPKEQVEKHGMYVIPLSINYKDRSYTDGVDITSAEIYDRFRVEIPSTSLPSGDVITGVFEKIKADGYKKVLAITISSGLSGTFNFVRLLAEEFAGLETFVVDTKNIGIASGMTAVLAAENLEKGLSWAALKEATVNSLDKVKAFFCVSTLKYLRKGGRIGLVSSILGENFHIKPIISCNKDGIYYTEATAIGRKNSLQKAVELVEGVITASSSKLYNLAVYHGNAQEEANELKKQMLEKFQYCKNIFEGQISPALVVHTGPGLIGLIVQML